MSGCYQSGDFFRYFKENMDDLGMPVPTSWFATQAAAAATIRSLMSTLKTLGPGASLEELVNATTALEKLDVYATVGASFYVGAAIGSFAVATGRSLACGTRIIDAFTMTMHRYPDMRFQGQSVFFHAKHPEVLDRTHPNRHLFAIKARRETAWAS